MRKSEEQMMNKIKIVYRITAKYHPGEINAINDFQKATKKELTDVKK